jgi:hypothetical protein
MPPIRKPLKGKPKKRPKEKIDLYKALNALRSELGITGKINIGGETFQSVYVNSSTQRTGSRRHDTNWKDSKYTGTQSWMANLT